MAPIAGNAAALVNSFPENDPPSLLLKLRLSFNAIHLSFSQNTLAHKKQTEGKYLWSFCSLDVTEKCYWKKEDVSATVCESNIDRTSPLVESSLLALRGKRRMALVKGLVYGLFWSSAYNGL